MSVVDLCIAQLVGCGVHPWAPVAGVGILSCPEILLVLFVSSEFGLYLLRARALGIAASKRDHAFVALDLPRFA